MSTSEIVWSALISLAVFVVLAATVEVLRRKGFRPVERIADAIAPLPTIPVNATPPVSLPAEPTVTTGNP